MLGSKIFWVVIGLSAVTAFSLYATRSHQVDFSADVKPILNKNCISCHGGVKREADFSLLFRADALAKTVSGKPAIIPGNADGSEMIRRITAQDVEDRMPYLHDPLQKEDIQTLRKWIDQGAKWGNHWAFVTVENQEVPKHVSFFGIGRKYSDWPLNDIDAFILDKLKEHDLAPSPQAQKADLLRRVSLDLTGIPASTAQANRYLNNASASGYEELVDSLLASPHYGERWTSLWMDLARYADTKGYERDDQRNIWRYRDWLINAFNDDKPYDQFLVEQIAGDLLPNATDAQYIATAFHRNTMTNDEGGTDNEEFRTAAVIDRVNTTWEALMGTSFGCVQCHSHPYDPFRHEEYYKFMAFFNNSRDEDTYADYPVLRHLNDTLQTEQYTVKSWLSAHTDQQSAAAWWKFIKTWQPSINSLTADSFTNAELSDTKWLVMRNHAAARLQSVDLTNKSALMLTYRPLVQSGKLQIRLDRTDGPVLVDFQVGSKPNTKGQGWSFTQIPLQLHAKGRHDLYLLYESNQLKNADQSGLLFDWFYFNAGIPGKGQKGFQQAEKNFYTLLAAALPATPVMMENPSEMHRKTSVFERGNWLVKGAPVEAATPQSLNPFPRDNKNDRLGLAMWLTDKKNPLVSRTIVNRLWEQLFGKGLAETLEDLGTQGMPPTHLALLDHLSWKLMHEYNWSLKKLLREIVMSATYQQDSKLTNESSKKDPANEWYARGPRVRLSAEQIRDQALVISGVFNDEMFGKSVMPYQPEGIWLSPWNGDYWKQSEGGQQYRRAVYTFWKRTAPYPSMMSFDGAPREVCTARRIRTNTPLQALTTLNDSAYFDMARHFAYRMKASRASNVRQQIGNGYRWATYKAITPARLQALMKLYTIALDDFKADKEKTCEVIGMMNEHNNPETAALVTVANAMLNLDEVVMKN